MAWEPLKKCGLGCRGAPRDRKEVQWMSVRASIVGRKGRKFPLTHLLAIRASIVSTGHLVYDKHFAGCWRPSNT